MTNGPSFRRVVRVTLVLLVLSQIRYLHRNFFPNNNNNKQLHDVHKTTPMAINQGSHGLKDEKVQRIVSCTMSHNSTNQTTPPSFCIDPRDPEYTGPNHMPPYVLERYKLLFFTTAKVGCTHWSLLFMRMVHNRTYAIQQEGLVHAQSWSELKLLRHYSVEEATHMMTSPLWTRAIFLRDPMERFVSAYLDKAVGKDHYVQHLCCRGNVTCLALSNQSAEIAFSVMKRCGDEHWVPQSNRISNKYMRQVNFIGRMETMQQDSERLLRRIGAWKQYGTHSTSTTTTNITIPSSAKTSYIGTNKPRHAGQSHATGASSKMVQHITPKLYQELLEYYRVDYENPYFNFTKPNMTWSEQSPMNQSFHGLKEENVQPNDTSTASHNSTNQTTSPSFRVDPSDQEYTGQAPYVFEKYKFLFFPTAKVACTHWKVLFMRMVHNRTYAIQQEGLVHAQAPRELKRLRHYSVEEATHMMTSPLWTRAIFLRDPMERFVSAYLDKAVGKDHYVQHMCCRRNVTCLALSNQSAEIAFSVMKQCVDVHWAPQSNRISHKYMRQVNFIGRMETMQQDSERLLRRIGAWKQYGTHSTSTTTTNITIPSSANTSYIGTNKPRHAGQSHATGASSKMAKHITPKLYQELLEYYRVDYENPYFNFTIPNMTWLEESFQQQPLTSQLEV